MLLFLFVPKVNNIFLMAAEKLFHVSQIVANRNLHRFQPYLSNIETKSFSIVE